MQIGQDSVFCDAFIRPSKDDSAIVQNPCMSFDRLIGGLHDANADERCTTRAGQDELQSERLCEALSAWHKLCRVLDGPCRDQWLNLVSWIGIVQPDSSANVIIRSYAQK
jgi:hypothetical protein